MLEAEERLYRLSCGHFKVWLSQFPLPLNTTLRCPECNCQSGVDGVEDGD